MSPFSVISGVASHVHTLSTTHGSVSQGSGSVSTTHRLSLRVGNRPAYSTIVANITDGDHVTMAGNGAQGEFEALAIRNDTTDVTYYGETRFTLMASYALYGLGVLTLVIFIGILLLVAGYVVGKMAKRRQAANALLDAAPRAGHAAT